MEPNVIVFCERCDMAVHQLCYGIEEIPSGEPAPSHQCCPIHLDKFPWGLMLAACGMIGAATVSPPGDLSQQTDIATGRAAARMELQSVCPQEGISDKFDLF